MDPNLIHTYLKTFYKLKELFIQVLHIILLPMWSSLMIYSGCNEMFKSLGAKFFLNEWKKGSIDIKLYQLMQLRIMQNSTGSKCYAIMCRHSIRT